MKKILLGTIAPIAFAMALCGAASAGDVGGISGTLSGSYATGTNVFYDANGAVTIPFNGNSWVDGSGLEALGGYTSGSGGSGGNAWYFGAALYTGGAAGRVAGNFVYHDFNGTSLNSYGVGGEWFATPSVTLAIRGGGANESSTGGGYFGTQGTWYACPNFAVSAGVDYWSAGANITSETVRAEWAPSDTVPFALYAGYQNLFANGKRGGELFLGVKLFTNGSGATTLVDRERTGTNGYISESPVYFTQY